MTVLPILSMWLQVCFGLYLMDGHPWLGIANFALASVNGWILLYYANNGRLP